MTKGKKEVELEVVSGPKDGQVFSCERKRFDLGRDEGNDISLPFDSDVGRSGQLEFRLSKEGKWIVENKMRKSAYLEGKKLTDPVELSVGQILKVGETELMVTSLEPGKKKEKLEEKKAKKIATPEEGPRTCRCEVCGAINDVSAKWCKNCGRTLTK